MSRPNQLTVLRMALTPAFAVTLTYEETYWKYVAFGIFILAALTDWYDGYVARKDGTATQTGKYLDPLADKLLVSTAFGIFAFALEIMPIWMFLVVVSRDIMITALRAYAITTGKVFETNSFAKWKTACQMGCIFVLLLLILAEQGFDSLILQKIEAWGLVWNMMFLVTVYTLTTGIIYLYENRPLLKSLAIAFYRVFVPTNVR